MAIIAYNTDAHGERYPTGQGVTRNTVAWAAQHDWFVEAREEASGLVIHCRDAWVDMTDGERYEASVAFTDRLALRAWAGY